MAGLITSLLHHSAGSIEFQLILFKSIANMNTAADEKINLAAIASRENPELSALEEKLFKTLNDIVQPGDAITAATAADQIDQLLRTVPDRTEEKKGDVKAVEEFLYSFWSLFIAIAQRTPHNHPGQARLLTTVESLVEKSEGSYEIWGVSERNKPNS